MQIKFDLTITDLDGWIHFFRFKSIYSLRYVRDKLNEFVLEKENHKNGH